MVRGIGAHSSPGRNNVVAGASATAPSRARTNCNWACMDPVKQSSLALSRRTTSTLNLSLAFGASFGNATQPTFCQSGHEIRATISWCQRTQLYLILTSVSRIRRGTRTHVWNSFAAKRPNLLKAYPLSAIEDSSKISAFHSSTTSFFSQLTVTIGSSKTVAITGATSFPGASSLDTCGPSQ